MTQFDAYAIQPEAFLNIDCKEDNFARIRCVESDLLYGVQRECSYPLITVVIPTYNRSVYFREALESVLAQKPADFEWEILVIDNTPLDINGTTPALTEIQQLHAEKVLYYHNRQNLGSGYNWNRGVELARGKWMCFLHDDDVLCRDALYNIGRQLRSYHGKRTLGYISGRRIDFRDHFSAMGGRRFPREPLTRFGLIVSGFTGAGSPTCGTVILKKAYMDSGGINYDYGQSADAVLCFRIMNNYAVFCSDRIWGGSRWDANETLNTKALLQMITADELLSKYAYGTSRFGTLWGKCFAAASSWRNIWRKQKIAEKNQVSVPDEEWNAATSYSKPRFVRRMLFLGLYTLYRGLRIIVGCLVSLRDTVLDN